MLVAIGLGVIAIIFSTCSASYYMTDLEQENEYDKYPSQSLYDHFDNYNELVDYYDEKDGTPESRMHFYDTNYNDFYEGDPFKEDRALPMKGERINCKEIEGEPVDFRKRYPGYDVFPKIAKNVSCESTDLSNSFSENHTFEAICKPNEKNKCITAHKKVPLFIRKKGFHNCWSLQEIVIVNEGCRCLNKYQ